MRMDHRMEEGKGGVWGSVVVKLAELHACMHGALL